MEVSTPTAMSLARIEAEVRRLRINDVSPTFSPSLPLFFPTPPVQVHSTGNAEAGIRSNLWELPEHSGSHVDAPFHFVAEGESIDALPADVLLFRPFKKFGVSEDDPQPGEPVTRDMLVAAAERGGFSLEPGDVAIVDFGWDRYLPGGSAGKDSAWWGMNEPGLSADACEYLARADVRAVACDTSACDFSMRDGQITGGLGHTEWFLPKGILIIEGLVGLADVPPTGMLVALPLKLGQGTASPLRVLLLTE